MTDRAHARLLVLAVLVLSLVVTLAARAFSLQVVDSESALLAAQDNRLREVVTPAARGMVLDQQGRTLAANRISLDVTVSRRELRRLDDDGQDVLAALASLLEVDSERLADRLRNCGTPGARPQPDCWNGAPGANPVIARDIGIRGAGAIMADPQGYPAVSIVESSVRDYPEQESWRPTPSATSRRSRPRTSPRTRPSTGSRCLAGPDSSRSMTRPCAARRAVSRPRWTAPGIGLRPPSSSPQSRG